MSSSKNGLKWGFLRGQKPNEIQISFELKIHIKNQKQRVLDLANCWFSTLL